MLSLPCSDVSCGRLLAMLKNAFTPRLKVSASMVLCTLNSAKKACKRSDGSAWPRRLNRSNAIRTLSALLALTSSDISRLDDATTITLVNDLWAKYILKALSEQYHLDMHFPHSLYIDPLDFLQQPPGLIKMTAVFFILSLKQNAFPAFGNW